MLTRRALLGALAAPAIIRPGILMPIKPLLWAPAALLPCDGRFISAAEYPLLAAIMGDYGMARLPNLEAAFVIATGAGHLPAGAVFALTPRIVS